MTEFSYQGLLDGHDVSGRVANGKITGNPFVTLRVQSLVDGEVHIGLGQWAGPATLDDEILARATVAAVVENPRFDPPPPLPDGQGEAPAGAVY